MPGGGRKKLPPWQNVTRKFKRWQLYRIYNIIATFFLQELQKTAQLELCGTLTPSEQ
jgi:hypothetical protein